MGLNFFSETVELTGNAGLLGLRAPHALSRARRARNNAPLERMHDYRTYSNMNTRRVEGSTDGHHTGPSFSATAAALPENAR